MQRGLSGSMSTAATAIRKRCLTSADMEAIARPFADQPGLDVELAMEIAGILNRLETGIPVVAAGFLLGLGDLEGSGLEGAVQEYPADTDRLYRHAVLITKLSVIPDMRTEGETPRYRPVEENLRKMLITMVEDVRVVLICLASQLARLRLCRSGSGNHCRDLAHHALEIHAPLANRLGVWNLKWELEDLALRHMLPDTYRKLGRMMDEKRADRERYIESLIELLYRELSLIDGDLEIHGRPKHFYSIWRKMQAKGVEFEQLWDIRAVRILVKTVGQCYEVLSVVHDLWNHNFEEFNDYIATPKDNGYQSIHTVVDGPQGRVVEIQIRTFEMHETNELGLAAHWRYKENTQGDIGLDRKIVWLRQLLGWKDQVLVRHQQGDSHILPPLAESSVEIDDKENRIYVFTPNGKVMDLPRGATPVDFAYAIHTEVGNRTRGAVVDGKMSALHRPLETGNLVQIHTAKEGGPSLDWLRDDPVYARTSRARKRIAQWHRNKEYEQHVSDGRNMLERELQKLDLQELSYERINQHTHFRKVDDLLAALGTGDYKLSRALLPFRPRSRMSTPKRGSRKRKGGNTVRDPGSMLVVHGEDNVLLSLARCCHPVPGEAVTGYVTLTRGISVHRKDCHNIARLDEAQRDRLVDVNWSGYAGTAYAVGVSLMADYRSTLLNDITEVLKSYDVAVLKVNMQTSTEQVSRINLVMEMDIGTGYETVVKALSRIQGVFDSRRV